MSTSFRFINEDQRFAIRNGAGKGKVEWTFVSPQELASVIVRCMAQPNEPIIYGDNGVHAISGNDFLVTLENGMGDRVCESSIKFLVQINHDINESTVDAWREW